MKNKKVLIIVSALILILILSTGCTSSNTTEINVVATTDLHGEVPYNITEYIKVEKEKNPNTVAVDAGDFLIVGCMELPRRNTLMIDKIISNKE